MTSKENITMKPIGVVRSNAVGDEVKDKTHVSEIIVNPELIPALDGIASYSHLYILFWMHEISDENRKMLKIHPRGRTDLPLVGAFAARTNHRPNPIGLTIVEFVSLQGNVLTIRGLDAFNYTPVLDIKPYDNWDKIENIKVPAWWNKLEEEKRKNSGLN